MRIETYRLIACATFLSACLLTAPLAAQDEMDGLTLPATQEDQGILSSLKPADMERFNKKLQEAMLLYYDRSYHLAAPLLKDVARHVPTLDILYWYGMASLKSGAPEKAQRSFEKMLKRNPSLHQVRLRLVSAYIAQGQIETAKAELDRIQTEVEDEEIKNQVTQAMENLKRADKRFALRLVASAGIKYDDNVNASPGDGEVPFGIGQLSTKTEADFAQVLNLAGNLVMDIGDRGDWLWTVRMNYYLNKYPGTRERFDYAHTDVATGLRYIGDGIKIDMPIGVKYKRYDRLSDLSRTFYVTPTFTKPISDTLDLQLGLSGALENFEPDNDTQDNKEVGLSFGPSWHITNGNYTQDFAIRADLTNHDARNESLSYEEWGGSIVFATNIDKEQSWTLMSRAALHKRDYNGIFGADESREDERLDSYVSLNKDISDKWSLSLYVSGTHNDSNQELYEYDKSVIGLSMTAQFDQ